MKKKVVIAILIVVLAGGGITGGVVGYRAYQNSKLVAEVQSVSMLNTGSWGDSMESDGTVTNGQQQDVYVSTEQTIQKVFVTEGQEVSEGDPLLQYDMTNIDLAIEMKKLDIQTIENNSAVAQKELEKLKNTKPISNATTSTPSVDSVTPSAPETPSTDTSVTTPDTVEEKNGDAYNYISTTAQPYTGDGSQENPYRFLCTKEAYVYGSYLNTLKSEGKVAVFEIHDGNTVAGTLISAWTKVGAALEEADPDAKWYVIDGSKVINEPDVPDTPVEPVVPDTPSVPDDNQQSGYTADELAKEILDSFIPGQFVNPVNPKIHKETTGPEIWRDAEGQVDFFVAGVGTGGTLTGIGTYLKSKNPNVKIVAVEPADSPVLSGGQPGPHKLQGIGAGFVPSVLNTGIYDEIFTVTTDQAFTTGRLIAHKEGILVGITSGAALYAAAQIAKRPENAGKTVVALLPDSGDRYLSTPMFAEA